MTQAILEWFCTAVAVDGRCNFSFRRAARTLENACDLLDGWRRAP